MPRLFVAVWPPPDVVDALMALPRPDIPGLRWTTEDQWHVTLRFLGAVDDVGAVEAALEELDVPAPRVQLGPEVGRFGQRVLHVPVAGLDDLAAAVVRLTAHHGPRPEDRAFAGHVTLARARRARGVDLRPLTGVEAAGSWVVGDLTLVESRLHHDGAHYEIASRWELRA